MLNYVPRLEDIRASALFIPHWMDVCLVSFTHWLLSDGGSPRYPLNKRMVGTQSRSGCGGWKKIAFSTPGGIQTTVFQPAAYSG